MNRQVEILTKKEAMERIKKQNKLTVTKVKPLIFTNFSLFERQSNFYTPSKFSFYKVLFTESTQYWIVERTS
ncbi:hypothetical protein IV70_GL001740 [Carnobacterium maltaromaticum DSM 20342]|nr:hypothetical protein IV70_GL001740 [Carnobacterium maltaromaticum DSM 20342]